MMTIASLLPEEGVGAVMCAFVRFSGFLGQTELDTQMHETKATTSGHFLRHYAPVAMFVIAFKAEQARPLA